MKKYLILLATFILIGCSSDDSAEFDNSQFVGEWRIIGFAEQNENADFVQINNFNGNDCLDLKIFENNHVEQYYYLSDCDLGDIVESKLIQKNQNYFFKNIQGGFEDNVILSNGKLYTKFSANESPWYIHEKLN